MLADVVLLIYGRVFPSWSSEVIDIGDSLLISAISNATGCAKDQIKKLLSEKGDLGFVAEDLLRTKKQSTLAQKEIEIQKDVENLRKSCANLGKQIPRQENCTDN